MSSSPDEAREPWGFACPRCHYDTRDLPADRCPECGITRAQAATLREVLARAGPGSARIGAACVTTLTGVTLGFIAVGILTGAYRHGFTDDAQRAWAITVLATCGTGIAITCINWLRVARPRRPIHFGWTLAIVLALVWLLAFPT